MPATRKSVRGPGRVARAALLVTLAAAVFSMARSAPAQGRVTFGSTRPFVIGVVPVVGFGAVGGVSIDASGVVSMVEVDALDRLRDERQQALQPLADDLDRPSALRKISLRLLEEAVRVHRAKGRPLPDEFLYLAGMQRVRYVFVYPERRDIVLAGFAEGWTVSEPGHIVGRGTGQPVLLLEDLIVALQTARQAAESRLTCSIDPSRTGVARLRRALKPGLPPTRETVQQLTRALGPQEVTLAGVPADSHFAHVMLAADVRMKRLAMGFEESPVPGLTSYMDLLQASGVRPGRATMPRWWLAADYEPLLRDAAGLAWEIRGPGVRARTEERAAPLARDWADQLSRNYAAVARDIPVFTQLRNCMDLAVAAALILKEDLPARADWTPDLLFDPGQVRSSAYPIPTSIASQATFFRQGRGWTISLSGGVEIDSWSIVERTSEGDAADRVRSEAAPLANTRWWWD
jgi:Protein of unknown function (DUF1598)